jgi:DNA-binding protein HU-beta
MNKAELVAEVAAKTKLPPEDVARAVNGVMTAIVRTVTRGDKVVLSGFGTFYRQARAARVARNVWADQPVKVPARSVPAFRPGQPFRETVARRRRRSSAKPAPARPRR